MLVIKTVKELREWRSKEHGKIGFVPTMGYLHGGHTSLIKLAMNGCDHVVVSIFVNPMQFGPKEDFKTYPRDITRDLELLRNTQVDVVFLPEVDEIYPQNYETIVSITNLSKRLEGKSRPGHFDGVATIVLKLFNIVQPTHAYFGQKDAQQVVIIKKMVADLQLPIEIVVGETIRERNGLALSSRNMFLDEKERKESVVLSQSLALAQKLFQNGERNRRKIKKAMEQLIQTKNCTIDYISFAHPETLNEITSVEENTLVSLAVYFGKARLIDNTILRSVS